VVKIKHILLTFDIEEFDMPLEFGLKISEDEIFERSFVGTKRILELVNNKKIKSTFFITPRFASKYPELVKEISEKHEVALHGYHDHSYNYKVVERDVAFKDLKEGKEMLSKITGKEVKGFREPRLQKPPYSILKKTGFEYDSSLNPTFIPGRYNNLISNREPFSIEGVKIYPLSVTPLVRLPLFWFAFRNLGLSYGKFVTKLSLMDQDFANLVFHSWEFIDLNEFKVPLLLRRNSDVKVRNMLDKYIDWCLKKKFKFICMGEYNDIYNNSL
tara:strand:+ start:1080 stop:1895 length:816 start_codon:yes stop_codon:yes gene_type:complete